MPWPVDPEDADTSSGSHSKGGPEAERAPRRRDRKTGDPAGSREGGWDEWSGSAAWQAETPAGVGGREGRLLETYVNVVARRRLTRSSIFRSAPSELKYHLTPVVERQTRRLDSAARGLLETRPVG